MPTDKKRRVANALGFVSGVIASLDAIREQRTLWPPAALWNAFAQSSAARIGGWGRVDRGHTCARDCAQAGCLDLQQCVSSVILRHNQLFLWLRPAFHRVHPFAGGSRATTRVMLSACLWEVRWRGILRRSVGRNFRAALECVADPAIAESARRDDVS